MKSVLMFAGLIIFSLSALASGKGGGATTVGDGGVVVACKGQDLQLLDLFEQKVLSGQKEISLLPAEGSVRQKINDGLNRIQARYNLAENEMAPIRRAAVLFMRFPFDPFHNGLASAYSYFLQIKEVWVRVAVAEALKEQNCRLKVAVIRPPRDGGLNEQYYRELCGHNFAEYEGCFYTNLDIWRSLKRDQRACLVVHEVLRYLPPAKKAATDLEMRQQAADLCTL
jgi:hypothetical protein